ncbi:RAC-alpha serine/threonine-protein kinase [Ancistrocladus abbreviatus]
MDVPRKPLCIIDNVVNGFFGVDIFLTFFVAYLDKTTNLLVDEPKKIAKEYVLSLKMVFDVVSMIPFGVAQKIYHGLIHAYGLYNMLRLWRLRRVGQLFARMEKDRNLDYFWVQCVKFFCVTLFAVHYAGCFCYHIAAHDRKPMWIESSMEDFLQFNIWTVGHVMSIYWVIINLITVGYGDMHPVNKWFDVLYMFFNFDLPSLRGNMTNLVVHISNQTRQYRNSIQAENQGADLDAPKTEGWTPRDLTERQGQEEIKTPVSVKDRRAQTSIRHSNARGIE